MTIQYDGTSLYGWQAQSDERTVQGDIEAALKKIFKNQKINLIGSGRTDAGVHALGQVANIKIDSNMDVQEFINAVNGNIGNDINILTCDEVDINFNSRFSAIKREYEYRTSNIYSPINRRYVCHLKDDLNLKELNRCAKLVLGEHDFTQLSKKNDEIKNKICMIYISNWEKNNNQLVYNIVGNRFLHHMVRYLVGMMIEVAYKHRSISIDDFKNILNGKKRINLYKAPAKGLYLKSVYYD